MFQLSDDEVEYLRSQFVTANISNKSRSNPYVFTEQGVYMLMTVLRGELAVKQSIALVRTFKKMKDYILENRELIGQREVLQLSMETANNKIAISKINHDMISLEKQISDVAEGLKDVVTKSELADMMNSFVSEDNDKWLMFNAKFSSADEVFESIYRNAKSTIYVVDNYIGLRTLVHLKNTPVSVGKYYSAIESMLIPFQSIPGGADMQEEAEKAIVFLWSVMLDCRHKILYN